MKKLKIGMLLFPEVTIQDFVGPYEVFIRTPNVEIYIVSESAEVVKAEGGLCFRANLSLEECPPLDIIFVPGGRGVNALLTNEKYLVFLQKQALHAQYITSVCTGSLVLAAAGLLKGYKATTHWRSLELLQLYGVETLEERVVIDRNRITGGGITAGIDFGLLLTALIAGEEMAKTIQLLLEYNPLPPFEAGSPKTAESPILEKARAISQPMFETRLQLIEKIIKGSS